MSGWRLLLSVVIVGHALAGCDRLLGLSIIGGAAGDARAGGDARGSDGMRSEGVPSPGDGSPAPTGCTMFSSSSAVLFATALGAVTAFTMADDQAHGLAMSATYTAPVSVAFRTGSWSVDAAGAAFTTPGVYTTAIVDPTTAATAAFVGDGGSAAGPFSDTAWAFDGSNWNVQSTITAGITGTFNVSYAPVGFGEVGGAKTVIEGKTIGALGQTLQLEISNGAGAWTLDQGSTATLDTLAANGGTLRSATLSRDGLTMIFALGKLNGGSAASSLYVATRVSGGLFGASTPVLLPSPLSSTGVDQPSFIGSGSGCETLLVWAQGAFYTLTP